MAELEKELDQYKTYEMTSNPKVTERVKTNSLGGSNSFALLKIKFAAERKMDEYSFQTDVESCKNSAPWRVFPEIQSTSSEKYQKITEELKLSGLRCIPLQNGIQIFAGLFILDILVKIYGVVIPDKNSEN